MLLQKELSVIEKSYYEASVARSTIKPHLCESLDVDICVVGGGYSGLSAALEMAERGYKVALLEAQRVGWGASGRNGGEVIVGFGAEGEATINKQLSKEQGRLAWDISVKALALLQERIQKYDIQCDYTPGYMTLAVNSRKARALEYWMEQAINDFNYPLQWIEPSEIGNWIASRRFYAGAYDPQSGHLHPLKYCLGLYNAAVNAGVKIFENSAVFSLERGDRPVLKTGQGEVRCQYALLATNVYISEYGPLAPEIACNIMPI